MSDMTKKYIPLTQQRYCCVPTCLQMVMYRRGIPLQPAEDIAYALGLTVPEEDARLFSKVRTGERPPAGWGTQIYKPEFEINKVLKEINIPLRVGVDTDIKSVEELRTKLQAVQDADGDALLCFDYGKLWDEDFTGGHVCVFDGLDDDGESVWMVDPERNVPKHRKASLQKLFEAIDFHGPANSCGIWPITKLNNSIHRSVP